MPKKKDPNILDVRKGATLREIYAQMRAEFTAADLQEYTENTPVISAVDVIAEMEEIHRIETQKLARKSKKRK